MPAEPRAQIQDLEESASLPAGVQERFNGYGVMGLPFMSGHILALRRFPASSVGPAYTSLWHRAPQGTWTFYADVSPTQACTRFFGAIAVDAIETKIDVSWLSPSRMRVTVPAVDFDWEVDLQTTAATRLMNTVGKLLPDAAWRNSAVLTAMGRIAGPLLDVGRVSLQGTAPNGQHFIANPRVLWRIAASRAHMGGSDFGPPGPVQPQARLGDFWIPQRGILAIGRAYFDPYDPARHSSQVCGARIGDEG